MTFHNKPVELGWCHSVNEKQPWGGTLYVFPISSVKKTYEHLSGTMYVITSHELYRYKGKV